MSERRHEKIIAEYLEILKKILEDPIFLGTEDRIKIKDSQ